MRSVWKWDLMLKPFPRNDVSSIRGGSIQVNAEIDDDISCWIGVGLVKWRLISLALCNKKVLPKLKGEFYITVVRMSMCYGIKSRTHENLQRQESWGGCIFILGERRLEIKIFGT